MGEAPMTRNMGSVAPRTSPTRRAGTTNVVVVEVRVRANLKRGSVVTVVVMS
jgi:hypothetical protein